MNSQHDRRSPLGGVKKETFVKSYTDPEENAMLTYDLVAGMASDLCHEIKKIQCHPEQCNEKFIKKARIRILNRSIFLPFSWFSAIIVFGFTCFAMGVGWLNRKEIITLILKSI